MRKFQCDKCKEVFDASNVFEVSLYSRPYNQTPPEHFPKRTIDLCQSCQASLMNWMMRVLDPVSTSATEEEPK